MPFLHQTGNTDSAARLLASWKMASAQFLEEALSNDVDESAVNAIVGSLENQLVTSASSTSAKNIVVNVVQNELSSANSIIGIQKQPVNPNRQVDVKVVQNSSVNTVPYQNVLTGQQSAYVASVPNITKSIVSSTVKTSDPIKVIYSQSCQSLNNGVASGRLTFPPTSVAIGSGLPHNVLQTHPLPTCGVVSSAVNKPLTMHQPLVIKQGTGAGQVISSGMVTVPMSVNASMPTSIPNVMTLTKPTPQSVGATGGPQQTIIPGVQIVNMRPGAPAVSAQKSVATVSPRVVIGTPQMVGTRPAAPAITLQTLQGLQPGQQGHLLLKTENGQYQLLRVGPAPAAGALAAPQPQAIRLSSVPTLPGVATASTSVASPHIQPQIPPTPAPIPAPAPVTAPAPAAVPVPPAPTPPAPQPAVATQRGDNTKEKCRNFLANLLDLSSREPKSVERNVRTLIQELIDVQVEPEEFCDRLERLLNASPQPCLIGFLKKSLPLLRQSLVTKELVIEGINPPSPHVVFSNVPAPTQPTIVTSNLQMNEDSGNTLTTLLPPVVTLASPAIGQTQPGKTINIISSSQIQPAQVNNQKNSGALMKSNKAPAMTMFGNMPMYNPKVIQRTKGSAGMGKVGPARPAAAAGLAPGKSLLKDKKNNFTPFTDDKMAGDDDINDVAAMGGVNLAEESQRILGSTELIGQQIRSCKDEYMVSLSQMQSKIRAVTTRNNLDEASPDIAALLSHALQQYMKNLIERLVDISQHRVDLTTKADNRVEVTQDVKGQLKFLEDLDKVDKKRREDSEREMLIRAAKSRSKNEDPEQAKLKAKAKEMQRAEMEELRQREANLTALQAIGPRKKPRLEGPNDQNTAGGSQNQAFSGRSQLALRSRLKRINHRDILCLMEQIKDTRISTLLYRAYLK